jgi:integrase
MPKLKGRLPVMFDGRDVGAIYQRGGTVNWFMDYRPAPGVRLQKSLGTSDQIEAMQRAVQHAAAHALDPVTIADHDIPQRKAKTLSGLLDVYAKDRRSKGKWNETSEARCRWTLSRFVEFVGADKSPAIISRELVKRWMSDWQTKDNSPATCISDFGRVRAYVNWLSREGFIGQKPDLCEIAPSKKAVRATAKKRSLSPAEVLAVAAHLAKRSDPYWAEFFAVAVGTGLRPAELAHVRSRDYDAKGQILYIREQEGWTPKTDSSVRRIPLAKMAPEVAEILARRKLAAGDENAFLFSALGRGQNRKPTGNAWHRASLHHAVQAACEGSGINVFPYLTRHTFARRCIAAGWSFGEVKALMGHTTVTTTEGYAKEVEPEEFIKADVLAGVLKAA